MTTTAHTSSFFIGRLSVSKKAILMAPKDVWAMWSRPEHSLWERTDWGGDLGPFGPGLMAELGRWLGDVSNVVLDC